MIEPLAALHDVWRRVVGRFATGDGTRFDYQTLRAAGAYSALRRALDGLGGPEVGPPADAAAHTALLVNVHNALVVEGVIEAGVTRTVRDARGFADRVRRRLGGHEFTLHELRYGLLGGNIRPPYRLRRALAADDPRLRWAPPTADPRVRLALTDGTRSGPPLRFYEPDAASLDAGLEAAARAFVNDAGGVTGCLGMGWYGLSPVFAWHSREFGGPAGVRAFVAARVESPAFADAIRSGALHMRVLDYDWGLDKCVVEGP